MATGTSWSDVGEISNVLDKNQYSKELDALSNLLSTNLETYNNVDRLSQYKCRQYKETNQEYRRRLLLEKQKRKRNDTFNLSRNIKKEKKTTCKSYIEIMDEVFNEDEKMEISSVKKLPWHKQVEYYKNIVMLSEWLSEMPSDLEEKWIMVLCPVGKRVIVVSNGYKTKTFSKKGVVVRESRSLLPPETVIDCIYSFETETLYVIDVIQWNGLSCKNCQTEFRFFWLKSKFEENPEFSIKSDVNHVPMVKLPRRTCNMDEIRELVKHSPFPDNKPKLDGLLFYHIETQYTSGKTPLVGWLKPFMIADAFGIDVAEEYKENTPSEYVDYKQFINTKLAWVENYKRQRSNQKMEVQDDSECISSKDDDSIGVTVDDSTEIDRINESSVLNDFDD